VYLLSCITGAGLGPDMVNNKGCVCYMGYSNTFTWVQAAVQDPLVDPYAKAFYEPVLELIYHLADGHTAGEAFRASLDKWNEWIDYWSRSPDPYAPQVLMWLLHDRDCQKLIGDETARVTSAVPIPWWLLSLAVGSAPMMVVGTMSTRYRAVRPTMVIALASGAVAKIVEVRLPEELEAGEYITGSVFVDNVGDARGKIGSLLHTLWDDQWYGGWLEADPGARIEFRVTAEETAIVMPEEDAEMEILAGVLLDGWDQFRRDDTASWTIKLYVPEVWPWWWPIAAVGGGVALITVVGVVAYQERKREEMLMMMLMR